MSMISEHLIPKPISWYDATIEYVTVAGFLIVVTGIVFLVRRYRRNGRGTPTGGYPSTSGRFATIPYGNEDPLAPGGSEWTRQLVASTLPDAQNDATLFLFPTLTAGPIHVVSDRSGN